MILENNSLYVQVRCDVQVKFTLNFICIPPFLQGVQGDVHDLTPSIYPHNSPVKSVRLRNINSLKYCAES